MTCGPEGGNRLGHVLRTFDENGCIAAMDWTLKGTRSRFFLKGLVNFSVDVLMTKWFL